MELKTNTENIGVNESETTVEACLITVNFLIK